MHLERRSTSMKSGFGRIYQITGTMLYRAILSKNSTPNYITFSNLHMSGKKLEYSKTVDSRDNSLYIMPIPRNGP